MRGKGQAIAQASGALVLLGVLVFGIPFLLVTLVGNPLPGELPSVDEIRVLLTQNGDGFTDFVINVLAILIWSIWVQLMLALVVEVMGTVGHTPTKRLPTFPGIQAFAARLVAMVTLAASLASGPLLVPAVGALIFDEPAIAAPSALTIDVRENGPAAPAAPEAISTSRTAPVGARGHLNEVASLVVADHTELWDLADAAYGDGVSWKLIARANAGAVDASGSTITNESEAVAPGTELALPGPINLDAAAAFGLVSNGAVHVVEAGDSMWTIAEAEIDRRLDNAATSADVAQYWTEVVDANQQVVSGDVDLIYPGEELLLPGGAVDDEAPPVQVLGADIPNAQKPYVPVGEPAAESETTSGVAESIEASNDGHEEPALKQATKTTPELVPAPEVSTPSVPAAVGPSETTERTIAPGAFGLAALGGAILSAGVVGAVRRRRDLQRRTRPAHAVARPASTEAAAFEAALTHSADQVLTSRLGVGWTLLPAATVNAMRAAGPVEIHASDKAGFAAIAAPKDGRTNNAKQKNAAAHDDAPANDDEWEAHRVELDTDEAADEVEPADSAELMKPVVERDGSIVPTSIVVGTNPISNEAVLLDLASAGIVGVQGDSDLIRRFVRTVILDLAVSDRADDLCVIAVGAGRELQNLERVHCFQTFDHARDHIVRSGHAAGDSLTPVIVVADSAPSAADVSVQALRELGAVVVAPVQAEVRIELVGDSATLRPTGTTVMLSALENADYQCVAELIDNTSLAAMELASSTAAIDDVLDVASATNRVSGPGPIDVKILGPVEITGADSFSSLKAVDVVSYLAFHRHGVDADQIKAWVWPAFDPPTDKAFANVMSRARTGLGAAKDGAPYLSRAGADKTYRLSEDVTTDFDRFRAIVDAADEAEGPAAVLVLLRQALELIRGVPFTGGAASSFAWADNYVRARVEFTIDETVHRCADLALEVGDLEVARWAALKGLELVPGCEQCFRRRFLVASAGNNRSELRRAMADLEASAMAELGEPEAVDTISGELLDLYHELDQALVAGSA